MGIFDKIGGFVNKITGRESASEKRQRASDVQAQIDAYKKSTELAEKQIKDAQASKDVEKRKINEKQIRSLRNNYRPAAGFLQNQRLTESNPNELTNKLGS